MRAEIRNIDGSEFVDMANLDRMSIKELRELGQKVEALIETKTKEEKIALVEKMRGMAAEMGLDARIARRVGLFHDLGKSLQPKYFIENLEAGEVSPHEKLPPLPAPEPQPVLARPTRTRASLRCPERQGP